MKEIYFNVKQEVLVRNIKEFAERAAKYEVSYTVDPLAFDEAKVSLEGCSSPSSIAILTGILTREE